jgi:hypothetical protein
MARQDEKGGLESVLGVVNVPQGAQTDSQDHWSVAAHQCFEGRLIVADKEATQQSAVGLLANALVGGDVADVPKDCFELRGGHR